MDIEINPTAREIIDQYMERGTPKQLGTEKYCNDTFKELCENAFRDKCINSHVRLRNKPFMMNEYDRKYDSYFQGFSLFTWYSGRSGFGYNYFLHGKCVRFFENNAMAIITTFLSDTHGDIYNAILETECFLQLWNEFEDWFENRRIRFMENMQIDIIKTRDLAQKKSPQSHGGVANLLKVLTKTMEKQGSDIKNIAKVQYAVCIQAGIYIPDEFIRDVAVTLDTMEDVEKGSEVQ